MTSIQVFMPPVRIDNTLIHGVDTHNRCVSVVFYVDTLNQDPMLLQHKFKVAVKYLMDEHFIDKSTEMWSSVAAMVIGKPPQT